MAGISLEKIEALAPDQASLVAARKLVKPSGWSGLSSDNAGLIWGECQGSGSSPYRVIVSESDAGYKCTCPSRKFPCKHSLALMWMRAEGKVPFEAATTPEWVQDWLRRRRTGAGAADNADKEVAPQPKNLAKAVAEKPEETDPKAEERAAAARERSRREREDAIVAGLDDLDTWLLDQADAGLAGFAGHAGKSCRSIAQRLVDAKAPSLASRVDALPARLFGLPDSSRPMAAVEQLGQLHLIAEAYRRQESLAPELCADVRREVGWMQTREALLSEEGAITATGRWRITGTVSEVQPDKLRRLETWLWREDPGEGPRAAVLLDFVPVAAGQTKGAYRTGEQMHATLVFYPSARPLRALVKEITSPVQESSSEVALGDGGLLEAFSGHEQALAVIPWLNLWPLAFTNARLRRSGESLFLCPGDGDALALPLMSTQWSLATPLLAIDGFSGFGLWDGYAFRLCLAQTPLGRWVAE
ncbi:SWIM zinc finger family protein [Occallatibacter savannae]|uniref:SWIM zinc finger family protein n=1 Tax=Occallatibacter savannae TaxID=1002691 RepID=UPI000D69475F|nr:SWIM zinc finger family protein [Occallatibacter savannae]